MTWSFNEIKEKKLFFLEKVQKICIFVDMYLIIMKNNK